MTLRSCVSHAFLGIVIALLVVRIEALSAAETATSTTFDDNGNLTATGSACAPGATVSALRDAKEAAVERTTIVVRKALQSVGIDPIAARKATEEQQPEISPVSRDDKQTCVQASIYVAQATYEPFLRTQEKTEERDSGVEVNSPPQTRSGRKGS